MQVVLETRERRREIPQQPALEHASGNLGLADA